MSHMSLHDTEATLLATLARHEVQFMVVGGRAVQFYGHLRPAKDLDIWYTPDGDNPKRVMTVLRALGIGSSELTEAYLAKPNVQLHLNGVYHTELLSFLTGVSFSEAYARREFYSVKGTKCPVVSRVDLIQNKKTLGRPQDLEDIEVLSSNA